MHLLCVAGARPNFMKIKPVLDELERRGQKTTFVHTGQHYGTSMSEVFFQDLDLRSPDIELKVGSGTQAQQTSAIMVAFEEVASSIDPDIIIVVGDVTSTLACGLVAAKMPVLLAHIEAGLRSRDRSMPEEINRLVVDHLSDFLLAPSPDAVENLRSEGIPDEHICLAGNLMIDTLQANLSRVHGRDIVRKLGLSPGGYVVATLHRPKNVDDHETLARWVNELEAVAEDVPVIFPVHPRTLKGLGDADRKVRLLPPLGYLDFVALEMSAGVVVTDSGGVQEETTVLGVPCLTVRDTTERPITVEEGTNEVVGSEPTVLGPAIRATLERPPVARKPQLWDGKAAPRAVDFILNGAG